MTNTATEPRALAPPDADAVAATLRDCAAAGEAIVPHGGGTLQSFGNAPTRCDVVLSLAAVRGIAEYDPREMTAGVHAGTTLAELARALAAHGQQLPFDAPHPERATIGGTLAAGWAGPRRARHGRPRDLVIGSVAALVDGTLVHAGGMVVKNVSGYDMSKIYVGSLGTLGVIVRANVKTLPRAAAHRLAVAAVPVDARDRAIASVGALAIEPSAAFAIEGFARTVPLPHASLRLVVLFEGSEAVVERATRDLRTVLGAAGVPATELHDGNRAERLYADVVDAYVEAGERSLTYRSTGLPSTAWTRSRTATALGAEHDLHVETIADLRTGDVVLRATARSTARLLAAVGAYDAGVRRALERTTVLAGAPVARAAVDAWGAPPSTIATMRALKDRFDPEHRLAPGRYVGGI